MKDYINSRLRACGYRSVELFNDKAIKTISKYSGGLLRRINILADKSLLASYADNANTVTAKHVELASRETEFVSKRQWPVFRWGVACISVFALVAIIMNINVIKQSSFFADQIGGTETADVTDEDVDVIATKTSGPSLMLVKEVREDINSSNNTVTDAAVLVVQDKKNNKIHSAVSSEPADGLYVDQGAAEIIMPEWQKVEQEIYYYPDTEDELIEPIVDSNIHNNDLLEIRDLIKAVSDHGNEEKIILMNQLTILPSETAINHESVASDLTCKLCSTIIYRPLTDGKKL